MPNPRRVVGENALTKVVRLLARFNERFSDPEVEGMESIYLEIEANGSGRLVGTENNALFHFQNLDQLVSFLEGPPARQLLEITA